MAILKGATVRQIMPAPIVGVVDSFAICQQTGKPQVLVVTETASGDHESRFFDVDAVEEVPVVVTPAPAADPAPASGSTTSTPSSGV